jgi:hypothetical protein
LAPYSNITFGVNSAVALLLIRRPDVVVLESWPVLATAADDDRMRGHAASK